MFETKAFSKKLEIIQSIVLHLFKKIKTLNKTVLKKLDIFLRMPKTPKNYLLMYCFSYQTVFRQYKK